MPILALVDDLLFQSKLEAAARSLGVPVQIARQAPETVEAWPLAVVDLNASAFEPLTVVRALRQAAPRTPIIGFCAHVQTDLMARAREAGCTEVLPRSAFVQRLPELLSAAASQPSQPTTPSHG